MQFDNEQCINRGKLILKRFIEKGEIRVLLALPCNDRGSIDAYLVLIPTALVATLIFGLFNYGQSTNSLALSAHLVGRQIARHPGNPNLVSLTESIIKKENLNVSDFHVMRFPIGKRIFIQLVLVGETRKIWGFGITPSARSLTVEDKW